MFVCVCVSAIEQEEEEEGGLVVVVVSSCCRRWWALLLSTKLGSACPYRPFLFRRSVYRKQALAARCRFTIVDSDDVLHALLSLRKISFVLH